MFYSYFITIDCISLNLVITDIFSVCITEKVVINILV